VTAHDTADHRTSLPGSSAKQAARKQQLRTWKLQQQSEEEKRRVEDEERSKREEEIRKIRDLSNQDEQYNRFMKLVGGKAQARSKVRRLVAPPSPMAGRHVLGIDPYRFFRADTNFFSSAVADGRYANTNFLLPIFLEPILLLLPQLTS
jgi:hypothetical protein